MCASLLLAQSDDTWLVELMSQSLALVMCIELW